MSSDLTQHIKNNLDAINEKIAVKKRYAGFEFPKPRLIAVSKVQPDERIEASIKAGQRVFGENRVQEAKERWQRRRQQHQDLTLILIGSLQTNKAAEAVALFDEIQSLDRLKLAHALKKEMDRQQRNLPVMIQVNTGEEAQKGGCLPADLPDLLQQSTDLGLNIVGLMSIPPQGEDPSLHFHLLKKLARRHGFEQLSMGMSSDYDVAAAMGATDIRVGTALFGERDYS